MECYICSKKLPRGYLCKKHTLELKKMIETNQNIIDNPDFKCHCQICGESQNRVIVEYPNVGYFCNLDIDDELKHYTKLK